MDETRENDQWHYMKVWEHFAGKPYVKPTPKENANKESIKEIVRRGQELLCGIQVCWIHGKLSDYYERNTVFPVEREVTVGGMTIGGVTYPMVKTVPRAKVSPGLTQSLGELCIELEQNRILLGKTLGDRWGMDVKPYLDAGTLQSDIQELRTKMYHKHTDPEKERETARRERLIELLIENLTPVTDHPKPKCVHGGITGWTSMAG